MTHAADVSLTSTQIPRRSLRALGLFVLLVALYFMTYTGQPVSSDELILFDAAHSFVQQGNLELAYTSDLRPYTQQKEPRIVIALDIEPMQVTAAAPLLWLGAHLPGVGLLQTTWLLNIFVTALTAVVLFYYGIALGYTDRTALVTALIFGGATIAWPYSRMFFREPLFTLLAIVCAYNLERWRHAFDKGRFLPLWLLTAVLAFIGMQFTKEASMLVVPTLLLIALPGAVGQLFNRRAVLIGLVVIGLMIAATIGYRTIFPDGRFLDLARRLPALNLSYLPIVVPSYLLSPGFSLWTFSPALLLGLPGAYGLLRLRRWREFLVPLSFLLAIVIGYSVLQGPNWYGGKGWGPRYLTPVTPFMALWLLIVVQRLLDRTRPLRAWQHAVAVGIIVQSVLIQIIAVIVPVEAFGTYLYHESFDLGRGNNLLVPWLEGTWNPLYIPPVINAHQYTAPSPLAWVVTGSGWIVLPLCLLAAGTALWAIIAAGGSRKYDLLAGAVAGLGMIAMLYGGLLAVAGDIRLGGSNTGLQTMLSKITEQARPGDAVLLNDGSYRLFFMNFYKRPEPVYVMPLAQGERLTPPDPPEIVTNNPEDRPHPYITEMTARLARVTSRWWFVTEFGPYSTDRFRPIEQYLTRHYYALDAEVYGDPNIARVLLFAPVSALPDTIPPWPQYPSGADFGATQLVGFDLPRGNTARAGSSLPITLLWQHNGWGNVVPFDYSVNISLISADGVAVAQRGAPPMATFAPMSQWIDGGYYHDNHALSLPADLPPGQYQLWVLLFDWRDGKRLPVSSAAGEPLGDHLVLTSITVSP